MGNGQDSRRKMDVRLMTESEIEDALLMELSKRPTRMDMARVCQCLDSLYPFDKQADAERARASLEIFHKRCGEESRADAHSRRPFRVSLLIAAVFLLITAIGYALGINVWKVTYEWARDHLFIQLSTDEEHALRSENETDNLLPRHVAKVWGDELYDWMIRYDVFPDMPSWKPDGVELAFSDGYTVESGMTFIDAEYRSEGKASLALSVVSAAGLSHGYIEDNFQETDVSLQRVETRAGIDFYIYSNLSDRIVAWISNDTLVYITMNADEAALTKMIDSMEKERY